MPPGNTIAEVLSYIQSLMTTDAGFFQSSGYAMFGSICLIVMGLYGSKIAAGRKDEEAIDWHSFVMLMMRIGFCGGFITFWNSPVPGFGGLMGYQIVANSGQAYAVRLENGLGDQLMRALRDLFFNVETPWLAFLSGASIITEALVYGLTMFLVVLNAGVVLWAIILGYFGTAICVLLGPLMIPFMLLPSFEYVFWNWLRAFACYAFFYPIVAFSYLYVFGNLIYNYVHGGGPGNLDFAGTSAFVFLGIIVASIGIAWMIPSIAAGIAMGGGGQRAAFIKI